MNYFFLNLCFAFRLNFYELIPTWHMYFNMRMQKKMPPLYSKQNEILKTKYMS